MGPTEKGLAREEETPTIERAAATEAKGTGPVLTRWRGVSPVGMVRANEGGVIDW
jgi:hypothetical protein